MNWELLLQATLPIFAAMAWGWKQLNKRMDRIDGRMERLADKLDDVRDRVGHLEGAFYERGHWESRKIGGEK